MVIYIYRYLYIHTHTYTYVHTHTHTLHYWMTDCKPHHTGGCPGPEVTLTFLNPVWVKSLFFFSCVHTIIVAVKFWYSCKKRNLSGFCVFFTSAAHNSSGKVNLKNPGLCLQRPVSNCGRKKKIETEHLPWGIYSLYTNVFSSGFVLFFPT